jgi:hypothetical protein
MIRNARNLLLHVSPRQKGNVEPCAHIIKVKRYKLSIEPAFLLGSSESFEYRLRYQQPRS